MKLSIFIFTFLLASPFALSASSAEITKMLATKYSATHFTQINDQVATMNEGAKKIEEVEDFIYKKNLEIVQDLNLAVKLLSNNWDAKLATELVRVSNLLQQNDPSDAIGSILLPLYKKKKSELLAEIHKLPKKQSSALEKSIENEIKILKTGNG